MPYSNDWNPNEILLTHNGVNIYHTYKDDEENGLQYYWFGTAADTSSHHDETLFDVRELPTWKEPEYSSGAGWDEQGMTRITAIKEAIVAAMDGGHLTKYVLAGADRMQLCGLTDTDPTSKGSFDLDELSASQLDDLLTSIHVTTQMKIEDLYRKLNGTSDGMLELPGGVDYTDGAEYTVTGIFPKAATPGIDVFHILQDEDEGPSNDEQLMKFMSTATLIEILQVMETIAASRSTNL